MQCITIVLRANNMMQAQSLSHKPMLRSTLLHAPNILRGALLILIALLYGCASSYSSQGVQYSAKNRKSDTYSPLPLIATEARLIDMLENVTGLVGTQYRYGGDSEKAFDCSGFVQHIYRNTFNAKIPRTARRQSEFGEKISRGGLQRGDLVFFRLNGGSIDHVGIYIDNGLFVHASSSRGVTLGNLDKPYYNKRFARAIRLLQIL